MIANILNNSLPTTGKQYLAKLMIRTDSANLQFNCCLIELVAIKIDQSVVKLLSQVTGLIAL